MDGEGEFRSFIKVWITVLASLTYSYFISKNIPKGFIRLLSILPIISIFLYLPLHLSTIHLIGPTGFFISWLANFKLLLFSFDRGPLSSSSSSLRLFIIVACLPVKIFKKPNPSDAKIKQDLSTLCSPSAEPKPKSILYYAIEALFLALLLRVYEYKQHLDPNFILFLYCFHMYFTLEILLAMGAALARFLLGLDLEPQFDDPYLSTSLQDFWGRRWNLMVTSILRSTVYEPIRPFSTRILGRTWGLLLALLATFAVSGLMHELIFFYLSRVRPTWEVMWFFALHGTCLAVEISVKNKVLSTTGRWRLHPLVSGPLTLGFVGVTGSWLFFPCVWTVWHGR
ncbi:hypothetical protein BVC80_157g6 [Macleaya cordata]|uniref:Wax synthase domain-containing protein n=1 Tax=Macleaya cordata TaxID=56857 RepID=A0A200RBY7_MACCD|nr:hypothetical protein BVC80_157g6 [Macleaya cordata]